MALEISNHSSLGGIGAAGVAQDQWWWRVFSGMVVAVRRLWNQPSFDARRLVATCLSVKRYRIRRRRSPRAGSCTQTFVPTLTKLCELG